MDDGENKNLVGIPEKGLEINLNDLFGGDYFFEFAFKKTQKILSALYLVSNLFSDNEPLKWHLREGGSEVLSDIVSYFNSKNNLDLNKIKFGIFEIISLLEVAENSGIISPMNSGILRGELGAVFETISGNLERGFVIPSHFFDVPAIPKKIDQDEKAGSTSSLSNDKGHVLKSSMSFRMSDIVRQDKKGESFRNDVPSESRRVKIISIIRKNKIVGIKDIKMLIPGCSEKTIQRDLLALVAENVLNKIGERRWSRYELK